MLTGCTETGRMLVRNLKMGNYAGSVYTNADRNFERRLHDVAVFHASVHIFIWSSKLYILMCLFSLMA